MPASRSGQHHIAAAGSATRWVISVPLSHFWCYYYPHEDPRSRYRGISVAVALILALAWAASWTCLGYSYLALGKSHRLPLFRSVTIARTTAHRRRSIRSTGAGRERAPAELREK